MRVPTPHPPSFRRSDETVGHSVSQGRSPAPRGVAPIAHAAWGELLVPVLQQSQSPAVTASVLYASQDHFLQRRSPAVRLLYVMTSLCRVCRYILLLLLLPLQLLSLSP